jgi:anti-sigma regulatory factor (Ser/Thr protein kinase)
MYPEPRHLVEQTFSTDLPPLDVLRTRIVTSMADVDRTLVSDVELIATELVTNAYLHGRPPAHFRLSYLADPARLRMEVTDAGATLPRMRHPNNYAEHGRGLLLVDAMSTAWGVLIGDVGKTVWAEFALPANLNGSASRTVD